MSIFKFIRSKNVRLYHGSNVAFKRPLVELSVLPCDFGKGFYTTVDKDKAEFRAREKPTINGKYYIMEYDFDEILAFGKLNVLRLDADAAWAKFVMDNRTGIYSGPAYDVIIGPSADGNTHRLENRYRRESRKGKVRLNYYLKRLKPGIYGEQWVFTNQAAVDEFISLNNVQDFR